MFSASLLLAAVTVITSCWTLSAVQAVIFQPLSAKPGLIDNGTFGHTPEVVHLFVGEPPIGITVSTKLGRAFTCYNRGDLVSGPLTVAEIVNSTTEVAWPSLEFNTPPGGLVNTSSGRNLSSSDSTHFINAQAIVFDAKERLWILDNGRPAVGGDNLPAVFGGPKLMGFDVANNATTPFTTITFSEVVLPSNGYLNDVRFDLRANLTESGGGVAYITDSGIFGIIVVDLGTGKSWRHLSEIHSTSPTSRFLGTLFGVPTYVSTPMLPGFHSRMDNGGADGLAIDPDGTHIYFTPLSSRNLFRAETSALRIDPTVDNLAFLKAMDSVQFLGETGGASDGLESDTSGKVYLSGPEHNSINTFDINSGLVSPFVRNPIIAWPDTMSVAEDGFLYATLNQLWLSPGFQNGTDKRVKPFALIRVPIEGGRINLV